MRALITGVGGFAGQHLAEHLLERGDLVWGAARHDVAWHVPAVRDAASFTLVTGDLRDASDTRLILNAAQPEQIYHLAAQSAVPESFVDPIGTLQNNAASLVNLLEGVRQVVPRARVLVVSSSEVYGRATTASPLDEHTPLRPENPYAVSKATADLLGYQYFVAHQLYVVRVRPFNYIGPGQTDRFVTASFARQIAEIEAGFHEPSIATGNLEARRDFTDVRDMVAAFVLALECGAAGAVYNLGSGIAVPIRTLLDLLISRTGRRVNIHVDPARLRQADAPVTVCDPRCFQDRTGWKPKIPLATTLDDTLHYWRDRVSAP
jgi:GDP-4-dehydro-6-deoxy-D-mannose reductase